MTPTTDDPESNPEATPNIAPDDLPLLQMSKVSASGLDPGRFTI